MSSEERTPVLVASARTPVGRFNGALRGFPAAELGGHAVRGVIQRSNDALRPEHILMGNVVQAGGGQNPARVVAARGGIDTTVPGTTINDVCLASMTAVGLAATMIRAGEVETALVGGFESMSRALHGIAVRQATLYGDGQCIDLLQQDGLSCSLSGRGMGEMSDEVNESYGISREEQDEFALLSHRRASDATRSGSLAEHIVPLGALASDEGVRADASLEKLACLKPAFTLGGTITAGNASQMSDAAAAGMVTTRRSAKEAGLDARVEVVGRAVVAGPDHTLHLKPAAAARKLLAQHSLTVQNVDLWEINEAFAGVVIASARDLEVSLDRVNIYGGAIAVGHPLGASGYRLVMTLATALLQQGKELGVASICGGGGQGEAILLRIR